MLVSDLLDIPCQDNARKKSIDVYKYLKLSLLTMLVRAIALESFNKSLPSVTHPFIALHRLLHASILLLGSSLNLL